MLIFLIILVILIALLIGLLLRQEIAIKEMKDNIHEMSKIMVNKKSRGNFGEYQMENILALYLGNSKNIMESQYSFSNGTKADLVLHLVNTSKVLAIDAKFPMENFQLLLDHPKESKYLNAFKTDLKKHIMAIADRYINEETLDFALMYLPSEAIYSYICSDLTELINFAYHNHVLITSPTTLAGVIFTLTDIIKTFQKESELAAILRDFDRLELELSRIQDRHLKANQHLQWLQKDLDDLAISIEKFNRQLNRMN